MGEPGLAPATVDHPVEKHRGNADQPTGEPGPAVVRKSQTRRAVARLLAEGVERSEIARTLGLSKSTVSYHARRLGELIDSRCARRYDWGEVQSYYDLGHSVRECVAAFGFSSATWSAAVRRGAIVARPRTTPISEFLVSGRYRGRHHLKSRLIKEGLKRNRCERCGLVAWRGRPLSMDLHHVNGDRHDNRLANLELLCPNCHSQTENYGGRNAGRSAAPP